MPRILSMRALAKRLPVVGAHILLLATGELLGQIVALARPPALASLLTSPDLTVGLRANYAVDHALAYQQLPQPYDRRAAILERICACMSDPELAAWA
jgi:hypothetical protein